MKISEATELLKPYKIWMLAPHLESDDPTISQYYDFTQSIEEYSKVFEELNADWQWQPVTIDNYKQVIRSIAESSNGKRPLIFNLCDGDEVNGTPGISVIHELEKYGLIYTGSDDFFYRITTSKIPMKKAFDKAKVATPNWRVINSKGSVRGICKRVGTPVIIKPAVSGGSMGVSVKNVVHNEEELTKRVEELNQGYHGWNLMADGLFVEQFIAGREFTTFITGSTDHPEHCIIYDPVERIFHNSLPDTEKFLSYDRLWETYVDESPMPENANFYDYFPVDSSLIPDLNQITMEAYKSCGGKGYARMDIRMDQVTGKMYMLEVNAQCGLSATEDYTSIGAILVVSKRSFTDVIVEILKDALRRSIAIPVVAKKTRTAKTKKTVGIK
jgi:D-alanine-D-alanine ligase